MIEFCLEIEDNSTFLSELAKCFNNYSLTLRNGYMLSIAGWIEEEWGVNDFTLAFQPKELRLEIKRENLGLLNVIDSEFDLPQLKCTRKTFFFQTQVYYWFTDNEIMYHKHADLEEDAIVPIPALGMFKKLFGFGYNNIELVEPA